MTAGIQCDTCRKFSPTGTNWLALGSIHERPSFVDMITGPQEYPPAFCGWRCLADYAIARALVEGQPAEEGQ